MTVEIVNYTMNFQVAAISQFSSNLIKKREEKMVAKKEAQNKGEKKEINAHKK